MTDSNATRPPAEGSDQIPPPKPGSPHRPDTKDENGKQDGGSEDGRKANVDPA